MFDNELVTENVLDKYVQSDFSNIWLKTENSNEKVCNWADYRVPNSNKDFDIGVGEFDVSEKYWNKGWLDIALKNQVPNHAIKRNKEKRKSKEWWE